MNIPVSKPAIANRWWPSASLRATRSAARVPMSYPSGGLSVSPMPRWSTAMTSKSPAGAGMTSRYWYQLRQGQPEADRLPRSIMSGDSRCRRGSALRKGSAGAIAAAAQLLLDLGPPEPVTPTRCGHGRCQETAGYPAAHRTRRDTESPSHLTGAQQLVVRHEATVGRQPGRLGALVASVASVALQSSPWTRQPLCLSWPAWLSPSPRCSWQASRSGAARGGPRRASGLREGAGTAGDEWPA
jgi:hypothetical protein